jgi:hypothetical protein
MNGYIACGWRNKDENDATAFALESFHFGPEVSDPLTAG